MITRNVKDRGRRPFNDWFPNETEVKLRGGTIFKTSKLEKKKTV